MSPFPYLLFLRLFPFLRSWLHFQQLWLLFYADLFSHQQLLPHYFGLGRQPGTVGLAAETAQIKESGPSYVSVLYHFYLLYVRGIQQECSLHPYAIRHLPYRETGIVATLPHPNDHTVEDLSALLLSLFGFNTHLPSVARMNRRNIRPSFALYQPPNIVVQLNPLLALILSTSFFSSSDKTAFDRRSGRRSRVRSIASSHRHLAISWWFPESNTSGTSHPLYTRGRVYCGYSRNP